MGVSEPCDMEKAVEAEHYSWIWSLVRWNPTSLKHIRLVEQEILKFVSTARRSFYVNIGRVVAGVGSRTTDNYIWTLALNEPTSSSSSSSSPRASSSSPDSSSSPAAAAAADVASACNIVQEPPQERAPPLLLLHGYGSGLALWCLNMDALARTRTVYAIDILGFGRSSRPKFASEASEVERQFVESIEAWRKAMCIERMFVMGHSMGGYLAAAYTLRYPERVDHLILADPWGVSDPSRRTFNVPKLPVWARFLVKLFGQVNPLSMVRLGGPWGATLIEWARADLMRKFSKLVVSPPGRNFIAEYIYHCNAQIPSGEVAFHSMCSSLGWARLPMLPRIGLIDPDVPMTCIYGSRSWIDDCSHEILAARRHSYVDCETLCDASHHVYADQPDSFNTLVLASYDYPRERWLQGRAAAGDHAPSEQLAASDSEDNNDDDLDVEDEEEEELENNAPPQHQPAAD